MYQYLTYDEFCDIYQPIENTLTGNGNTFETYGAEQDFVFAQDPRYVWTEVDGDGGCYIIAGMSYVNRVQYYVCDNPWTDDSQEVCVNYYRECSVCGCYGGYGTTDNGEECPECSDESNSLVLYPENREDLIEVYGDRVNEQV
jgi:hypothetical protein